MKCNVWYMRPEFFRDGNRGAQWLTERNILPCKLDLRKTHVLLREEVQCTDLWNLFLQMQAEHWSPNGEARDLILSKGLQHTSMCVGDVAAVCGTDHVAMVNLIGFYYL